jgi:hypothetical protein
MLRIAIPEDAELSSRGTVWGVGVGVERVRRYHIGMAEIRSVTVMGTVKDFWSAELVPSGDNMDADRVGPVSQGGLGL